MGLGLIGIEHAGDVAAGDAAIEADQGVLCGLEGAGGAFGQAEDMAQADGGEDA